MVEIPSSRETVWHDDLPFYATAGVGRGQLHDTCSSTSGATYMYLQLDVNVFYTYVRTPPRTRAAPLSMPMHVYTAGVGLHETPTAIQL